MSQRGQNQLLAVYSAVSTIALVVLALSAARSPKKAIFDEITVGRININEPDGTPRLIISNNASAPGSPVFGKEQPRPDRPGAGIRFVDDEGTEIGGLSWGGKKEANGETWDAGHLSFDRYHGDQIFTIQSETSGEKHGATIKFDEENNYDIAAEFKDVDRIRALPKAEQEAAWAKFHEEYRRRNRIMLGKMADKSAELHMRDTEGRDRVLIKVAPDGNPSIELLDEKGKTIARLPK